MNDIVDKEITQKELVSNSNISNLVKYSDLNTNRKIKNKSRI